MTAFNTRRNLLALLLAVVLACSLFTVGVFAEEETTTAAEETTVADEETTEAVSGEETTEGETTEHDHDEETTTEGDQNFWEKNFTRENKDGDQVLYWTKIVIWGLVIAGLIAGVVFCIVKREKVAEFLRALNSEKKRIVWSSWKDTRKNTLVVLLVVAAITLVIFLFNLVLEKIFGGASTGGDLWFEKSLLELIVGLFH
ncbi:MAG: preprotein translocase subunit SecE [Clostridia bacterium]|nr:preprotein translocase subunit SecE [Clostridia bacterium]